MVAVQVLEAKNLRRILKCGARIEMIQDMFGAKGPKSLQKATTSNDSRVFQTLLHGADEMFVGIDNLLATKGIQWPLTRDESGDRQWGLSTMRCF
ncbi:hypothetical protein PC129_g14491 [Phytophthora cactorum]|uniref:Uncharacterized protein n=1 Tax=Phytophthora cactorum TaxID=29920 RepID=A0A329SQ37_9STRA|nr:hypothetical protein PC112_g16095 [Phytophthora cactorum]KAG2811704.1 hypothetical protein PC111_g15129 [Phytophthora cactorum]KAG2851515.1 hypothetical protein PC113_g15841 [Phytophthora cactorum]KAG2899059.1 hypothetical protein PC114_g14032 [Phytophthora cactorum]KAG2902337.1 hypothetical protein PC115_g15626 [Phytophthora cactorum]